MTSTDTPQTYQAQTNALAGKIIAITGAGDGIGRIAALTFSQLGATVILLGRTTAKLESVYDEMEAAGSPQPAIYPINFEGAVEKDYEDMYAVFETEFGRLDGLLHNASELGERTSLSNYTTDVFQRLLQVNTTAPFMMTKSLLPLLDKADNASLVFTGSGVGLKGRAFWGAYAVSKAATENLMQTWADELEEITKIRVNSINPGATRTKMRAMAYPAENPSQLKTPNDIMPIYVYLMSNDSIGINGQQFDAQSNI